MMSLLNHCHGEKRSDEIQLIRNLIRIRLIRLDSDDYFYPQMSDRCYTDYSLIFKLQLTIYCVNMRNISNLFGGMKEKV